LKRPGVLRLSRRQEEVTMLRNLLGFALFAIIALFLLKVLFGLFGLVLGLLGTVLWFAFIGFLIYLLLKVFAPDTAARVRETISFSYQHGGASLLDFLQAQQDYRGIQLSYLDLVGAYLSNASQLNFAVGREVIP